MQLHTFGWNSTLSSQFEPYAALGYTPARIVLQTRSGYSLWTEQRDMTADVSGKFRHAAQQPVDFPTVGDWVAVSCYADSAMGTIQAVLPRRSQFSRKAAGSKTDEQILAANVDTAFLVSGLDHDFNIRRIERYLVLIWESGANPVVVLNKADLCASLDEHLMAVEAIAPGVPIVALSALHQSGLEALAAYLRPGQTIVLVGSSGVGKSTLTNRLIGHAKQAVQAVRSGDDRGRHTTTHRELFLTASGALIIDTPGLRELQLWSNQTTVDEVFTDIEAIAQDCRFRDCRHQSEPGCAVQAAIATGTLDPTRLNSYHKLTKELDYLARKQDERLTANTKARWKQIHKEMRRRRKG
jgi:ribosome biogenesis GTPase